MVDYLAMSFCRVLWLEAPDIALAPMLNHMLLAPQVERFNIHK